MSVNKKRAKAYARERTANSQPTIIDTRTSVGPWLGLMIERCQALSWYDVQSLHRNFQVAEWSNAYYDRMRRRSHKDARYAVKRASIHKPEMARFAAAASGIVRDAVLDSEGGDIGVVHSRGFATLADHLVVTQARDAAAFAAFAYATADLIGTYNYTQSAHGVMVDPWEEVAGAWNGTEFLSPEDEETCSACGLDLRRRNDDS